MTHFIPPRLPVSAPTSITKRQAEVLHLACMGLTNRDIGKRLHITEESVKCHMRRVLAQLGATDRTHAACLVYSGLVVEIREPNPITEWRRAA
jgi:DNA-binding NarL/FixJ family response regulator